MTMCTSTSLFYIPFSKNKLLYIVYFIGDFTSIWNHGFHSRFAIIVDRSVMCTGALIDLWYMGNDYIIFVPFTLAIFCYFISKKIKIKYAHVLAHVFISISHTFQLKKCF